MKVVNTLPLVYSCSGCSNIAQLANTIAVRLDSEFHAEMSCIAGVGGKVKPLVLKAQSGRKIIAIDGCALHCARHCLENIAVKPDIHLTLTDFGIKKEFHKTVDSEQTEAVYKNLCRKLSIEPS